MFWIKLIESFACASARKPKGEHHPAPEAPAKIQDDFDLKGVIGFQGSFGRVVEGIHRKTNVAYAVKLLCPAADKKKKKKTPISEAEILRKLHHANVVALHSVYEDRKQSCLVMEKYDGGDLFDLIVKQDSGRVDEVTCVNIMAQLLSAVKYLHGINIAHCDIKPSNIMFSAEGVLKLIDFGAAQETQHGTLHYGIGSPSYIAPEVLNHSYCEKADLWSVGVVLFVMVFGFNPFDPAADPSAAGRQKILARILKGFSPVTKRGFGSFFPESMADVSEEVRDLITNLLRSNPADRLSAAEALDHPWFKTLNVLQ
jgi:serine/threonine protein kinase